MRELSECKDLIRQRIEEKNRMKKITRRRVIVLLTVLVLTSCCFATFAISYITKPVPDVSESTGSEDGSLPDASASAHDSDSMVSNHNQSDSGTWFSKDESEDAGPSGDVAVDNSQNHSEAPVEMSEDNVSRHEETSKDQHGDPSADGSDDNSDTPTLNEVSDEPDESDDVSGNNSSLPDVTVLELGENEAPEAIAEKYEEFMKGYCENRQRLAIRNLIGSFPIESFTARKDSYSIGDLTVFDDGVITNEDDMLLYHLSSIGSATPESVGIYGTYDQLEEMDFPETYNVYCMKYVKEGIPVYAVSRRTVPYDYRLHYYLYFEIDGIWFRLISGGYYYPSKNGILRAPDQWRHAYKYETDPIIELSDVSCESSALIRSIMQALEG